MTTDYRRPEDLTTPAADQHVDDRMLLVKVRSDAVVTMTRWYVRREPCPICGGRMSAKIVILTGPVTAVFDEVYWHGPRDQHFRFVDGADHQGLDAFGNFLDAWMQP